MKTCEDKLLLKCSIEAGASLEALAKGNKKTPNKRKGGSICTHYYRTRNNLMTFFDPGIEPKDDTHMHDKDESYNSSDGTEVEYASLPVSLPSFSVEDYIVCSLNTEDTVDNIPDSQLLDSPENVLER
ncbi:hypothetical protein HanRHA438_Chr09g0404881 [Helianthus annuus]|nr:hypothetical protein HanRHA438_Chr09g0404881 [Helianthus annuus]